MRGLIYIVVLLVAAGCGVSGVHPRALDEAERMTMARWALLYSEAIAANKLSAPTDTIVDIAIDYYGRHNLMSEYQRASMLKD